MSSLNGPATHLPPSPWPGKKCGVSYSPLLISALLTSKNASSFLKDGLSRSNVRNQTSTLHPTPPHPEDVYIEQWFHALATLNADWPKEVHQWQKGTRRFPILGPEVESDTPSNVLKTCNSGEAPQISVTIPVYKCGTFKLLPLIIMDSKKLQGRKVVLMVCAIHVSQRK